MLRALMKRASVLSLVAALLLVRSARADEPEAPPKAELHAIPDDLHRLVLETGRREVPKPEPDALRFVIRGEYQVRYQVERSFTLTPSASRIAARPGLALDSLGQNHFVSHWLRVAPRLQIRDDLELVAQADVLTGLVLGERAHDTYADLTPRDEYNGWSNVQLRYLYAQYKLPFGLVRVGQQPNHWGMGLLANDGDHPTLFGDYRYGSLSERILFATRPGGEHSDFTIAVAGDLVYRDAYARLTRGQQAFQGVLAAFYEHDYSRVGVFTTVRHQTNAHTSGEDVYGYHDTLDALAVDVNVRHAAKVPGHDAFLYGEAEAVYVAGSTDMLRTADQALSGSKTALRSYGGAAVVGIVHRAHGAERTDARGLPFGDLVGQVEVGYASGDADPYDGTERRFTFDPNHRVGLLLFDEVLRFATARSATNARDPLLTNASRPTAGVDLLASNGGVFGAQYVNPTFIYRPRSSVDVKAGLVVAQATSEVVDPYRLATQGSYVGYRGGDRRKKDLGVELDGGLEGRFPLDYGLLASAGVQAGLLFPGAAFDDDAGNGLGTQWIVITRLGLQF
ncbi:MAG: hypothetical protein JWP97_5792 [Labilithrix sp.]|nr:hypothetical protein [Labilithrix sp.]